MKREFSSVLLIIYWLALPFLLLVAAGITAEPWLPGDVTYAVPRPIIVAMAYILPALIGYRLWVHIRARKAAHAAAAPEPENADD